MLTACSTWHFLLFAHTVLNTTTNDIYPRRFFLPPPRWMLLRLPANISLLRHFKWLLPKKEDEWTTAADQHTARLTAETWVHTMHCWVSYWGNYPQKEKSISIWYHTGSISLQHCRFQNFYYISQYRSPEINQRDESIFHILKLVLTATESHKTLLSIKEMDFLFRVWSKAARALLKQVMLKVLKHSASRFKPSSATGNHRGA